MSDKYFAEHLEALKNKREIKERREKNKIVTLKEEREEDRREYGDNAEGNE